LRLLKMAVLLLLLVLPIGPACASPQVVVASPSIVLSKIHGDKGHVVLVNFWATWCPPCVAEYPSLVKLDQKYRKQGLDVIAVSLDIPSDAHGKVSAFVKQHQAEFPQFVLQIDDPEAAIDAFDKSWQGDLPRTFVYGKHGKLIQTMPGPQTLGSLTKAVKAGLARPA
jgi:thiol-disulfide isomerase/thioredoxin